MQGVLPSDHVICPYSGLGVLADLATCEWPKFVKYDGTLMFSCGKLTRTLSASEGPDFLVGCA